MRGGDGVQRVGAEGAPRGRHKGSGRDVSPSRQLPPPCPCPPGARPCSPKYFGRDALVCVCNATYCDTLDPLVLPAPGTYVKYESSKAGKRLERSQGSFQHSLRVPGTCCGRVGGKCHPRTQPWALRAEPGSPSQGCC